MCCYSTAQRLGSHTRVASWPTAGRPAESIQTGTDSCQHPPISSDRQHPLGTHNLEPVAPV